MGANYIDIQLIKIILKLWAGVMAHQTTALAVLAQDLGLVHSTYSAAHSCLEFQHQGIRCLLLVSEGIRYSHR